MTDQLPPSGDKPDRSAASPDQATDASQQAPKDHSTPENSAQATDNAKGGSEAAPKDGSKTNIVNEQEAQQTGQETQENEEQDDDDDEDEEDGEEEDEEEEDDEEDDEDSDEDEEPELKYTPLTQHLAGVYRNGDATSAFLVAGDKMIVGTHNGNIHVYQLPTFQSLRVYHAHSASVTSISISPYPSPLAPYNPELPQKLAAQQQQARPSSRQSDASAAATSRKPREPQPIPKIPSNEIYIATSSMDGNVCVQSLMDMRDVQLRNFARPVQAVALSPEYKSDRTYVSGGLAGELIVTVGGGLGKSTSTTTGTAAATAAGWLGSMGLGPNTGKDTIQHSGEGTISTIKWSLSGKYIVWLNEHGIKLMRSNLHLENPQSNHAWKRFGHYDRPQTDEWETMASVWKGRVEWIDEQAFETRETEAELNAPPVSSPAADRLRSQATQNKKNVERLLVGWGGTIWIVNIHPIAANAGRNTKEKHPARPEIVKILRLDCIISGITLYTQSILAVLAYSHDEDDDEDEDESVASVPGSPARGHKQQLSTTSMGSQPSGGIRRRANHQRPELRLIDLNSQEEVDRDGLTISRYERLAAGDYHLGVLPPRNAAAVVSSRGALEAIAGIGTDVWNAAINPRSLFSSGASVRSHESGDDAGSSSRVGGSIRGPARTGQFKQLGVHPKLMKPGSKIFIHSPYDCILATKRDMGDHLLWLIERQQYQQAWELLDENPDILADTPDKFTDTPQTPSKAQDSIEESNDDDSVADSSYRQSLSSTEKEKIRVGELWLQQLVDEGKWLEAGKLCNKVLKTPKQWESWFWTFAGAKRFDEITNFIPSDPLTPPLPKTMYEVILGHYLQTDKLRFKELLDHWSTDLFDVNTIATTLENQLKFRDVREDSIEDGEKGRDWRIVIESLAHLHEANGRLREALKCYIKLQDADSTFRLIKDSHLADAVADDIPGFIGLRVSSEQLPTMSEKDLEDATGEAITVLVEEAQHGLVKPHVVIEQLLAQELHLYLFFYLRGLYRGEGLREHSGDHVDRLVMDSQSLVDDFADLAVHLFATYDRSLLMEFIKTSTSYSLEKAVEECELFSYYDELVYLYSKTGEMKRALYLIIDRLKNVHKAIEFAKEQDDADLWDDLLNYSMDKPSFIRGLLEQAGTAIDPIRLVRRIPEGLEIQGLREGLTHLMKEHEIQYSISSGVARVLRSEVAAAQSALRAGQRKGLKFEVDVQLSDHIDIETKDPGATEKKKDGLAEDDALPEHHHEKPKPGHCAQCLEPFAEYEMEMLLGYSCGHVFHVSHLLDILHKGRRVDVDLGPDADQSERYSVGRKVMRARLLRDKVRGGCPLCHPREA
ncbi:unnamed protein product [Clonostachys rhizophaga]|uniref:Vps41 beta-propeller domain-containing protein n=1 Tax=Clonostachys rhizophaga TaxID=160324 RepID=A0A9N9VNN4_9HYPO|nr:unnamed protein product [Clonostachys rhizophaga]